MLDRILNLFSLQPLFERMEQWHPYPAILPKRVGTKDDGSSRWAWGVMLEWRLLIHPGYSDVEYRLPGAEDSYVYEGVGCLEARMRF